MTQIQTQTTDASHLSEFNILSTSKFSTYKAYDSQLGGQVVVKVFPATASIHPKYQNEKSHLMAINHPNVIRILQAVDVAASSSGCPSEVSSYLVLEYASNGDLYNIVEQHGKMSEQLARTLFHQLIEGVAYLHSQNIAHLDLKMENILLGDEYTLKLADFDMSQALDSETLEGHGTVGCRAPEVKDGTCSDFQAADVYSAGVILFTLIAGQSPYNEKVTPLGLQYDKLFNYLQNNKRRFWDYSSRFSGESFSEEFKQFINSLLTQNPKERSTIGDIRSHPWYTGETLCEDDFLREMRRYMEK